MNRPDRARTLQPIPDQTPRAGRRPAPRLTTAALDRGCRPAAAYGAGFILLHQEGDV